MCESFPCVGVVAARLGLIGLSKEGGSKRIFAPQPILSALFRRQRYIGEEVVVSEEKSRTSAVLQYIASPALTAVLGLVAGLSLAQFNSDASINRFFLEKQAKTADDVAVEFSRYVENWARLIRLRKEFDSRKDTLSSEERENFKNVVFARSDAREKLFSSFDAMHLYFGKPTSDLALQFKSWDNQQAELTIEKLPAVDEWRNWQVKILRQLREEIKK